MDISEKIKALRKQRGLTLEAVGEIVGVGKSTVRKWENGEIKNMRRDKIALLANALGVTPGYLMGWEESDTAADKLNDIGESMTSFFPKYDETRIVSAGMDKLPKEQRERVLAVVRAMFANDPSLFDKKG